MPPGGIERQPGGLLATTDGPHRDDAELSRIDHREAALVLEVHVDSALAVRDRKLGFGIQRDGADDGVGPGIDGGGVATAPVEGEHALAGGIVEDRVGVLAGGLDLLQPCERVQIKHHDEARAPDADVPAAEVRCQRDPVHARGIGDLAGHCQLVGIDHQHARAVRDEQAMTTGFQSEVVPALVPRQGHLVGNAVLRAGVRVRRARQQQRGDERRESHGSLLGFTGHAAGGCFPACQ